MKEAGCVHLHVCVSICISRCVSCVSVHVCVSMLGCDLELKEPAAVDGHSCLRMRGFAQSRFIFRE